MKIHEYQAKELMRQHGIDVAGGPVVDTVEEGMRIAERLFSEGATRLFIKAQVHAGGRGKAGGIASAESLDDVRDALTRILGMTLISPQTGPEGKRVRKVMISDGSRRVAREMYLSVVLDRETEMPVILTSAEGGVEIEKLAANVPEAILKVHVDPCLGLRQYQIRHLVRGLGLKKETARHAAKAFQAAYRMFMALDCSQLEINPLAVMEDGTMNALDAKVSLDESAFYRHRDLADLRDPDEESPLEVWASRYHLNYVKLDGDIGCMVNGAGLAMATMDIIHYFGGEPANFLDVGGGADQEAVTEAFKILLDDSHVKAVLINIFGGIVRCDRVAAGVISAVKDVGLDRPMVVRLAGTNSDEGLAMLRESGLPLETASNLSEAAGRVVELARGGENS
ncbi:MAG TPA: ADP-forming succinate--CoA ligase subunit beta [bacterium]|nr:ADP-forming succinate--CoA ligase subunit beta [bacterium]